jgi:sugar phosphate permease
MPISFSKVLVFVLTFFVYSALHSLREGWSYSKVQIQTAFALELWQLGIIDTFYLLCYSVGMMTIGNLSSKMNLKYFVTIGMMLATVCYLSFSVLFAIEGTFSYVFLVSMMCFNGFFQSTGWPGVVGIMGNWFGKGKRGLLMGFWAMNSNVGNIIALVLCNILDQSLHLHWTFNFFTTGSFATFIAILCFFFLKEKPQPQRDSLTTSEQPLTGKTENEELQPSASLVTTESNS